MIDGGYMRVEFKHGIGDEVSIVGIGVGARVVGLCAHCGSRTYQVIYWLDGDRRIEWLEEWEIA